MILVITGGIGSGKSLVSSHFHKLGVPVYDSDSQVKKLYSSVKGLIPKLESSLGLSLVDDLGQLDKAKLAAEIFRDEKKLKLLEDIIFPLLLEDFNEWYTAYNQEDEPLVVFESATILEKEYFKGFGDKLLVVDAPINERIERVMARDGLTREEIEKRINNQPLFNRYDNIESSIQSNNIAESPIQCDFIIKNDNSNIALGAEVEKIYNCLIRNLV